MYVVAEEAVEPRTHPQLLTLKPLVRWMLKVMIDVDSGPVQQTRMGIRLDTTSTGVMVKQHIPRGLIQEKRGGNATCTLQPESILSGYGQEITTVWILRK